MSLTGLYQEVPLLLGGEKEQEEEGRSGRGGGSISRSCYCCVKKMLPARGTDKDEGRC